MRLPARRPRVRLRATASDEQLVARIRTGDDRAFEALYDRYSGPLLAFCRQMLGRREEAEDALQQVFVSAYDHLRSDERPVQLKPWLYAIARNRCLSTLRSRREALALDDVAEPSDGELDVASAVERRQEVREILDDVGALPDDQRAALVLAELGALSHDEIALALDVRRDKVKALVFQARQSLMGSRQARETSCREIQEQLAMLRGGALRRTVIRRHVAGCPACAAFKREVQRQRSALAIGLPVVPSVALKSSVLSAVFSSGSGAAAGAGGAIAGAAGAGATGAAAGLAGAGSSGLAVKVLATVAIAGGAVGGVAGVKQLDRAERPATARPAQPAVAAPTAAPTAPTAGAAAPAAAAPGATPGQAKGRGKPAAGTGRQRAQQRRPGTRGLPASARGTAGAPARATPPGLAKPAAPGAAGRKAPPVTRGRPATPASRAGTAPGRSGSSPAGSGTSAGRSGSSAGRSGSAPSASPSRPRQP